MVKRCQECGEKRLRIFNSDWFQFRLLALFAGRSRGSVRKHWMHTTACSVHYLLQYLTTLDKHMRAREHMCKIN